MIEGLGGAGMTRSRWLIIGIAVAAVAVALVVGQLWMTGRRTPTTPDAPAPRQDAASFELTSQTGVPGVIPPLPGGKRLASVKPTGPVRLGFRLHPLSSAPSGLIAGLTNGRIPPGSQYAVRFKPWGYGPAGPTGQTVVITTTSIVASGTAPDVSTMKNSPLLAVMDARRNGDVLVGGAHTGTLTFMTNEGQVIPVLSDVEAPE